MDSIYWIIIVALLLLAAFDLINGVANDAVNFLNSAIGSKAAPVRVILTVASIGVLVGACFSGGMMEVARNGIFHPNMFSYHEVMLLFLGVMISEVILLDTFNTFGLPTSTTVSLVFGILGSAVATALFKISKLHMTQSVWDFINTDKAFEIVTGILLSVAIAFTVGTIVMWVSRLAFTFKYQSRFKWFGCFWCGIAMTAVAYFAVFKGLKESTLMEPSFIQYIDQNLGMALLVAFGGFSVLMFLLQHLFMTNILRLTVLAGTFSLALAFAGNDLVNFIGVFMGGLDSFQYATGVVEAGGSASSIVLGGIAGMAFFQTATGATNWSTVVLVLIVPFALGFVCTVLFVKETAGKTMDQLAAEEEKLGASERDGNMRFIIMLVIVAILAVLCIVCPLIVPNWAKPLMAIGLLLPFVYFFVFGGAQLAKNKAAKASASLGDEASTKA